MQNSTGFEDASSGLQNLFTGEIRNDRYSANPPVPKSKDAAMANSTTRDLKRFVRTIERVEIAEGRLTLSDDGPKVMLESGEAESTKGTISE
jgi:hypothetical protein